MLVFQEVSIDDKEDHNVVVDTDPPFVSRPFPAAYRFAGSKPAECHLLSRRIKLNVPRSWNLKEKEIR